MIPSPWEWALLALAAFRIWKLIADDALLDRPRVWVLARLPDGKAELFIVCPWCLGWWLSLAWVVAFWLWPHGAVVAAVPFAVSAAVGLIASALSAVPE